MGNIQELYQYFLKHPSISTDTRKDVSNTIFFALSGENFNGNKFAEQALNNGAVLAVIDDKDYLNDDRYFLVPDVLLALQELAHFHRKKYKIPVIGITGSNGKTTTKELISAVLDSSKRIITTEGNLNNHIGVPLTVLKIKADTEIAIVEMGANHPGEIKLLSEIADPTIGIITNIGKAHLEGFGSFEGVIKTKNELFEHLAAANSESIVNRDDQLLMSLSENLRRVTYGTENADVTGVVLSLNPFLEIKWHVKGEDYLLSTKIYGRYNLPNIMAAIASGIFFGILPSKINEAIGLYTSENNRSQQVKTKSNSIILDAYNANPVSMNGAILSFKESNFDNPWMILGDMFEIGESSMEEHQKIIDLINSIGYTNFILVGNDFKKLDDANNILCFATTKEAFEYLRKNPIQNANILVKGSRGMQLETLLTLL